VIGAVLALLSATVWGVGDFSGGVATRRGDQYQVLAVATFAGIVMLAACALLWREPLPPLAAVGWAAGAGLSGTVGLACLYRGLARGSAATVAPTAAVITASVPVLFTALTAGLPRPTQLAGFVLAMIGIWLVSRTAHHQRMTSRDLELAVAAGLGFGGFLTLIAQVESHLVFMPLTVTKLVTFLTALTLLLSRRVTVPHPLSNWHAWVAGACDAGGNIAYLFARQFTRLDVAAVLSSLYPATTVLLAWLVTREHIAPVQWVGAVVCLAAVVLITL
jgi:drug/metabolite transporter (DMT)-like permease